MLVKAFADKNKKCPRQSRKTQDPGMADGTRCPRHTMLACSALAVLLTLQCVDAYTGCIHHKKVVRRAARCALVPPSPSQPFLSPLQKTPFGALFLPLFAFARSFTQSPAHVPRLHNRRAPQNYNSGRRSTYQNMRIAFDYSALEAHKKSTEHEKYVKEIMSRAGAWLTGALKVVPVSGNLKVTDAECSDKKNIPTKYVDTGSPDTGMRSQGGPDSVG